MEIKKVLETVFIKDWNTTALIMENEVVVRLWNNVFHNRKECFEHINTYSKGWVQTTMNHRYLTKKKVPNGATEYLIPYDKLFDELEKYATSKFKEFKNINKVNSFNFKWYTSEEKQEKEDKEHQQKYKELQRKNKQNK